jgi:hypothetical protein
VGTSAGYAWARYFDTTWGNRETGVDEAIADAQERKQKEKVGQMKFSTLMWVVSICVGNVSMYWLQRIIRLELGVDKLLVLITILVFMPILLQIAFMPFQVAYLYRNR